MPGTSALALLRPLGDVAPDAVERLLDEAFGTERHGRTAYRLRAGTAAIPALSFAALDEMGALVGTLQSWPVALAADDDDAGVALVLVGPVAVARRCQRHGIGRLMMERMLRAAEDGEPLVLIGDPDYYGRFFGFDAAPTQGWTLPGPVERHRLLVRTRPGRMLPTTGTLGPRA